MIAMNTETPDNKMPVQVNAMPGELLCFPDLLVLPEEFNHCITGMTWDCTRVVYDVEKIVAHVMAQDDTLTKDDAWEHFTFNIECAFPSDGAPIWIHPLNPEQLEDQDANQKEKSSNHTGQPAGTDNT